MFPQTPEQGGVANRVNQLKAGIMLKKNTVKNIQNAVKSLIDDGEYRKNAISISDGFKKCSGVKGAVEKILNICKKN